MSVTITRENLDSQTNNKLTVIDFWAPWCGPCKIMDPILNDLESKFNGKIHFGKMNVDGNQDIAEKYHVLSIPSLVIFKNGEAKEKVSGIYSKEKLAEYLNKKVKEVNSIA